MVIACAFFEILPVVGQFIQLARVGIQLMSLSCQCTARFDH